IRAPTHTRDHRMREAPVPLQRLGPRLLADDGLEIPNHAWKWIGAHHGPDDVVGRVHIRDPVAQGFVRRVLERPGAGRHGHHGRPQESHAIDVEALPPGVLFPHVDDALEPELGAHRRGRDAMLARPGFRDDAALPHAQCQEDLAEGVVDLVGAGVVEVFALAGHADAVSHHFRDPREIRNRRRPPNVVPEEQPQLVPERLVFPGGVINARELLERRDECLGDIPATVRPEASFFLSVAHRGLRGTPLKPRTAAAGSCARATASPTRTKSAPAAASRSTAPRSSIPLSATARIPFGTAGTSVSATLRSVTKVLKSRLLIPTAVGDTAIARSSSCRSCASTSVASPNPFAPAARRLNSASVSARTIRSTNDAPAARASRSCSSSTMKSLRRTGMETALLTCSRSSREPPKCASSVSTEMVTAPPAW